MGAVQNERMIDQHSVRFMPPDRVEVRLRGTMEAHHVEAINRCYEEIERDHGRFVLFVDTRGVERFTPEARGTFAKAPQRYPFRHVVIVVASAGMRTLISMVFRACRLLAPARFDYPVELVADEAEALARVQAAQGAPGDPGA